MNSLHALYHFTGYYDCTMPKATILNVARKANPALLTEDKRLTLDLHLPHDYDTRECTHNATFVNMQRVYVMGSG